MGNVETTSRLWTLMRSVLRVRALHVGTAALIACVLIGAGFDAVADDTPTPDLEAAATAYNEGRYSEAIRLYSQILKQQPTHTEALCGRGMAHEMSNQQAKAEQDYRNAILSHPGNYRAMENLAGIWERSGKHIAEAAELYRRALAVDPRPEWKENLKVWIAVLESRSKADTESPVGCWHAANAKAEQGDHQAAEALYTKAIALNSRMFQAYFNRGLLRSKAGDLNGALRDFDEAIRIAPKSRGHFVQRGLVRERMGDPHSAAKDFQRAVSMDPRDPEAFFNLARMQEESGDFAAALQNYQQATKLRPKPELSRTLHERVGAVSAKVTPEQLKAPRQKQDSSQELW